MRRGSASKSISSWGAAALLAGGILFGGCVVAAPPGHVVVRPPVTIAVHLAKPGWDYVQVRGVWYYGPRGTRHFRHNYYVFRRGAWVFVR